jgi:hypothetical protein
MQPEKAQRLEKTAGYSLLAVGLLFIIVPACLALVMYLTSAKIPQLVPPVVVGAEPVARALLQMANAGVVFFIFAITVWAGSILTSRGVMMIKDVKLKLVGRSLKEAASTAKKVQRA